MRYSLRNNASIVSDQKTMVKLLQAGHYAVLEGRDVKILVLNDPLMASVCQTNTLWMQNTFHVVEAMGREI